ncbi:YkgJ family cysteine cluster protein [Geomesophilobacter sediminis]|uniref:YkgJ family cysteine cluster protein n=1 Tax=Geomesophilobacter sediminis TaxID=2798584 RepID=A0A8J7JLR4_9BACT|nr:YkgJ family cysteine cluster protein [Geomesophilobacter sediminis]MBJ6725180.1 YkgJ family cysteine cluster protein [Geomesophilobacter sediminis]
MTGSPESIDQLVDLVKQQQAFLEMFVRSWVQEYRSNGGAVFCAKGCRNCCSLAVHTGFAEAVAVARFLDEEKEHAVAAYAVRLREQVQGVSELSDYLRRHRQEIGFCPFLDAAGACSAYPVRPLTCRSLISTRESIWCGIDFATLAPAERDAYISGLDRHVVAFPSHYVAVLQEAGQELEDAGAKRMRELLGFAIYGNLGVLVHLIRRHGLAEACLEGPAEAAGVSAAAGFDSPLLVTVS